MPKRTGPAMSGRLTALGLGEIDRQKCLQTFRAHGEGPALEQAREILQGRKAKLELARQLARRVLGRLAIQQ